MGTGRGAVERWDERRGWERVDGGLEGCDVLRKGYGDGAFGVRVCGAERFEEDFGCLVLDGDGEGLFGDGG